MAPRGSSPSAVRAVASLLLGMVLALSATLVVTPTAGAASTILCKGYQGCRDAGMGNAGYAKNRSTMYWRMYAGHNCTNYAAYRMVRSGLPNVRPWEGSGNAHYWGYEMAGITDTTPRVGAIAWWRANTSGIAGSSGHIAYVEKVVSTDTIIVSQDSWGGDFSWARITRSGTSWPAGFIHFNDVPMVNRTRPTVEGTVKVGATLTANGGRWRPGDPALAYQWRRNGRRIAGATSQTYTVPSAHRGARLSVSVTASKLGYPTETVRSTATTVLPGELVATQAPAVTGTPVVDGSLTAAAPTWNVAPGTQTYQWLAANAPVEGATRATFVPGPDHVGKRITVQVTATRDGYEPATTSSPATVAVAPGTLSRLRDPAVTGLPRPGEVLSLDPGEVTPQGDLAVAWLRDGTAVDGASGTSYPLTAADLGSRITARVTHSRAGYTTLTAQTPRTARVRSLATMAVRSASPRAGVLRLVATVTASEVAPVTGTVVFRSGRRFVATAELVDGAARVVLRGLPSGSRNVKVRYRGSPVTSGATVVEATTVR